MTGFNSKRDAAADKDALFQKFEVAQPAQEPVAQVVFDYIPSGKRVALNTAYQNLPIGTQLYTTPSLPAQEPIAYVTGMSFGRFIVEPLNPAMVLPVGMALYSASQGNT